MSHRSPILFLVILLLVELYAYKGVRSITKNNKGILRFYLMLSIVALVVILFGMLNFQDLVKSHPKFIVFTMGLFFVNLLTKFSFIIFHFAADIYGLIGRLFRSRNTPSEPDPSRRRFITKLGLGVSSLFFGGLIYGIVKGKFNFRVMGEEIYSDKIPAAFDGLKIVQISDAHLGSFLNDFDPIIQAVNKINELEADYVFFTGDMVNNNAREALPWVDVFSKIKAKRGKFSIFGNHDYADYGRQSKEEKVESIALLKSIHKQMGFRLLEDEHVVLERGGEAINLIGVHNWGRGFHQVGDLEKALYGLDKERFSILLSHDPTHYDRQVKQKTTIDLTLSGHTHGAQMGIEIPEWNIKWSPIQYIYPQWAGLYKDGNQQLYVNRGFGVLAYPGRLGVAPEITLLTLRSES